MKAKTPRRTRALQARLDIARRNEQSQAETLELTAFREQAGLVGSLDVEQARASVEQTRAQIPSLEASIAQATYRLATLAGAEPGSLTARLSAPAPLPAVPDSVAVAIPAVAAFNFYQRHTRSVLGNTDALTNVLLAHLSGDDQPAAAAPKGKKQPAPAEDD